MRTQPKTIVVAGESAVPPPTKAIKKPKSHFTPPKRSPLKSSPVRNLKPSPLKATSPIKKPSLLKGLQNSAENLQTPTHSSSVQKAIERNEARSLDKTEKSKPSERTDHEKTAKSNKVPPNFSKRTRTFDLQASPSMKKSTPIKSLRKKPKKNMPYTPPSSPETLVIPPHIKLPMPYNPSSPSISAKSDDSFVEKEDTPVLKSSNESPIKQSRGKNEITKGKEDNFLDNLNFDRRQSLVKNDGKNEENKRQLRSVSLEGNGNRSPIKKKAASPQKDKETLKNNRSRRMVNSRRQAEEDEDYKEEEEEEEKEERSFLRSPSESPFPSPRRKAKGGVQSKSKAIKKERNFGAIGGGTGGGGASNGKIGTSNNTRSNGGRRSNFAAMVLPTPPPPANSRKRNPAKGGTTGKKRGKAEDSTSLNSEERNFREGTKRSGENYYMNVENELNQLFEESEERERQESSERNMQELQKYTNANMISNGLISELRKNMDNSDNPAEFGVKPERKKYHSKWSKRLDWKLDRKLFNNMTDTELCVFFNNATWFTWNIETEEIEEEDEDGKKKRNLRRRQNAQKAREKKGEGQNGSPGQKAKKVVEGKNTITRYVASGYLNFDGEEISIDPVSCFDSQLKANGMCFKKMMKEVLDRVEEKEFFVRFEVMDRESYYDGMNMV